MKIIALGDTHGRPLWKEIIEKEKPDKIVFIGDYFDSWDISAEKQIHNFLDICTYKEANPDSVVLLIGNHDYHYIHGENGTSGWQKNYAGVIHHALKQHLPSLQMAHQVDNILFTHAGVSSIWLESNYSRWEDEFANIAEAVNYVYKHTPEAFLFNGNDPYGNDTCQTPIWIRPSSLMKANGTFKKDIIQVVGHTRQKTIDIEGKSTGGFYYFIDAIDVRQYLIIEDGQFKLGKI